MKQFFGMRDHHTGGYSKSDYSGKIAIYASNEKNAVNQLHNAGIVNKWYFSHTSCDCCGWVDCSITDSELLFRDGIKYIVHNSKLYSVSDFAKCHPVIFAKFYNEVTND